MLAAHDTLVVHCLVNFVYCTTRESRNYTCSPIALVPVRGASVKISRASSVLTRIRSRFKQTHVIREWILWEKSVPLLRLHAHTHTHTHIRIRDKGIVESSWKLVPLKRGWLDLYTGSSRNVSSKIEWRHEGLTRFRPRLNVAIRGRKSGSLWFILLLSVDDLRAKLCNKCYEIEGTEDRVEDRGGHPTYYPYRTARDRVPLSCGLAEVSRSNWINIH